jgi:hypothetical protein
MAIRRFLPNLFIGVVLLLAACGGAEPGLPTEVAVSATFTPLEISAPATEEEPTVEEEPASTPRPYSPAEGEDFLIARNEYFAASGNCTICHDENYDAAGNDVSFGELWRSSMMANSALDPYYLAGVSMNTDRFPEFTGDIESKCSSCHMPMAHVTASFKNRESLIFGPEGYLESTNPLHKMALDGVSCTTCHQIQDRNLGEFSSFSGGFEIDQDTPMGNRILFGRFVPNHMSQNMMAMNAGFISQPSEHLLESEICATCHNLYTHYVTEDGTFSEDWFAEQTPYTEWLHSDFATRSTCQDCHMPIVEGSVVLSNRGPGGPRSPVAKHSFAGGNVYMLNMLKNFGGELGVQADTNHFQSAIDRSLAQLQGETAELEISDPELADGILSFDVTTTIQTGHKFPTGYPSRRAWLHLTVMDSAGQVLFESGRAGEDGAIVGNANDEDGQAYEAHYDQITSADQVQIYESIMTDVRGDLTTVLLAASSYLKDNRLLPTGFDKATAADDIKPYGDAVSDENFTAGRDIVRYEVSTEDASGPFLIEVELLYQSISYRWAAEISQVDTESAQIFSEYYDASPNLPVVITSSSAVSD